MGNDRTPPERRSTVAQAADVQAISAEAVRGRIRRGALPVGREGRTVCMLLEAEEARDRPSGDQARTTGDRPTDLLIAELQDRVRSLEEAARGNGCIIAALTARIPAIEAPADEQDDPETVERKPEGSRPVRCGRSAAGRTEALVTACVRGTRR